MPLNTYTNAEGVRVVEKLHPNVVVLAGEVDPETVALDLQWAAARAARDNKPLRIVYRKAHSTEWAAVRELIENAARLYPLTRFELPTSGISGIAALLLAGRYPITAPRGALIYLPQPQRRVMVDAFATKLGCTVDEAAALMGRHSVGGTPLSVDEAAALGLVTVRTFH